MLQIVEQAHRSDTGRQRAANEDSFFAESPVFAVADGMGGAQAGEVASKIAADSFAPAERGDSSPEAYLRGIAESANRRIHELAQSDSSRSGMGTTFTAAMLEGEELSIAHVGDSRAYRLRGQELKLLTSDHSLVEELRRQGRLTDEQAEDHPQRSIITRALGPEPQVQVDTMTYRVKPGDIYLLCSDGLTTMLKENQISSILLSSASLSEGVRALVDAANMAGGRDNITAVAFRVDDDRAPVGRTPVPAQPDADAATLVGVSAAESGLSGAQIRERAAASQTQRQAPARRAAPAEADRRRPSRRRVALRILIPLLVLAALVAGGIYGARQVYFLGSDTAGRLALYRGLPYDLPLGISLYSEVQAAPIQVSSLPVDRQASATNHTLRGHDDAVNLLDDLVRAARTPKASKQKPAGSNQKSGGKQGGKQQAPGNGGRTTSGGKQGSGGAKQGSGGAKQGGGGGGRK